MKLDGKVALVTGGGSGIGRAIALLFAREGASVVVNGRTLSTIKETAKEITASGGKAIAIKADVSDAADVDVMVDRIVNELGGIHILVNNAGIPGENVSAAETSIEHWDKVVGVHLRGTYLCCRKAGQWMVRHKTGKILNISSVIGLVGFPTRTSYGPAKAGIINITQVLAIEWARDNINVNCIAPGSIVTPMDEEFLRTGKMDLELMLKRIPCGYRGEPEDIAGAALFLVSDEARYITGVTLPVDGGWLAYGDIGT